MAKFKVLFDGKYEDVIFDSEEEALDYALDLCSCARLGAQILPMSNPGDYPYDEDTFECPEFEIEEIDED